MEYLIWSIEHDAWWAPHWNGYTKDLTAAGRYSKHVAEQIVRQANIMSFNECMIPIECVTGEAPPL